MKKGLLKVVYEDAGILIVDKETGVLTIGDGTDRTITLYKMASEYVKRRQKREKVFIVNRLDKYTSGLVAFAKSYDLKLKLQSYFEDRSVIRKYEAVVDGVLSGDGTLRVYLIIDKLGNVFLTKKKSGAKEAITHYRALKSDGKKTLLDISIETGRKNQIRLSFASIGHPILGDMKYGKEAKVKWKELALRAYLLEFPKAAPLVRKKFEIERHYDASLKAEF